MQFDEGTDLPAPGIIILPHVPAHLDGKLVTGNIKVNLDIHLEIIDVFLPVSSNQFDRDQILQLDGVAVREEGPQETGVHNIVLGCRLLLQKLCRIVLYGEQ